MTEEENRPAMADARPTPPSIDGEKETQTGYTLDAARYDAQDLKLADDGHTVLIPQPSDDPDDPLNWPWRKKLWIVFTMSTIAFLPEFGSAVGIPAIVPQSM